MNAVTVKILIEAFAINAEIEGMKALNQSRERRGESQAYSEESFEKKASYLYNLSNTLHENWQKGFAE
jgi:hypothetical protein